METNGWESWEWDETLFAGAAEHYVKGRLPYAPGLAEAFAKGLDLDGRGRLLDVGCGPGVITLRLARLFEAVVGLDPDPGMLKEARRIADEQDVTNATWVQLRAEALPAGLGSFRVITFAASFHWTDRPKVASAVKSMLDRGGGVVQVDYRPVDLAQSGSSQTLPHPPPPQEALVELRTRFLGPNKRAGRGVRNTSPSGEDEIFQAAGFLPAETVIVPDGRRLDRTIDDLVASTFSSSPTAPHLFGNRIADFEADLRALLAAASPSALFSVLLPDNRLRIWRVA